MLSLLFPLQFIQGHPPPPAYGMAPHTFRVGLVTSTNDVENPSQAGAEVCLQG